MPKPFDDVELEGECGGKTWRREAALLKLLNHIAGSLVSIAESLDELATASADLTALGGISPSRSTRSPSRPPTPH